MNKPDSGQEKKAYRQDKDEMEAKDFEMSRRKIEDMNTGDIKSEIDDVVKKLGNHALENGLRVTRLGSAMMGRFIELHEELQKRESQT